MDRGVAVDFAGRSLEHLDLEALGQPKHVDRTDDAGLGRLYGILLVVNRRSRARQIEDLVHLDEQRMGDVVAQELETLVIEEMLDIAPRAGEEIVDAQDLLPSSQVAARKDASLEIPRLRKPRRASQDACKRSRIEFSDRRKRRRFDVLG